MPTATPPSTAAEATYPNAGEATNPNTVISTGAEGAAERPASAAPTDPSALYRPAHGNAPGHSAPSHAAPQSEPAITAADAAPPTAPEKPASPAATVHANTRPLRTPGPSEVRQTPATPKSTRFPVRLVITCDDRSGMLKQLTATISDDDTNIRSVDSKSNPDGITANVEFVIETLDLSHLTKLTANLRRLPGIREVHRVSKL